MKTKSELENYNEGNKSKLNYYQKMRLIDEFRGIFPNKMNFKSCYNRDELIEIKEHIEYCFLWYQKNSETTEEMIEREKKNNSRIFYYRITKAEHTYNGYEFIIEYKKVDDDLTELTLEFL